MLISQHGVREILKRTGPAVGVVPDADYAVREVVMDRGELLFAYTDGLTDTANAAGEYFSEKGLIPLLTGTQPLVSLLEKIQGLVQDYSAGTQQVDDITLLAVRRLAS